MTADREYRFTHQDPGHGRGYDNMYSRGYYRHLWREVERPLLDSVLDRVSEEVGSESAVDLACGTGRVSAAVAEHFKRVVGLDVSESMLARARRRLTTHSNLAFKLLDLQDRKARDDALVRVGPAQCVTAFRLFTNADPDLRTQACEFAHELLADGGMLVVNTHIQPNSPAGRIFRVERVVRRKLGRRQRRFNNVLSADALADELQRAGFTNVEIIHYGAFPHLPKAHKFVPRSAVTRAEKHFGGRAWNQCAILIAKKTDTRDPKKAI